MKKNNILIRTITGVTAGLACASFVVPVQGVIAQEVQTDKTDTKDIKEVQSEVQQEESSDKEIKETADKTKSTQETKTDSTLKDTPEQQQSEAASAADDKASDSKNKAELMATDKSKEKVKVVGIKNNGSYGIKININAKPYTTYAKIPVWGEYAYGESGCAWFASSRAKQVTGKGTTIWSGKSWYNSVYKTYKLSRGSVPAAGALACFEGHIGYVEKVSGSDMIISEGGSWYYSDAEHGYCVIRKINIKKYESQMGSKFLGYVYLKDVPKSVKKENIKSSQDTTSKAKTASKTTKKITGWVKSNGKSLYYGKDGKKYTGWHYMGKTEGEKTPHWSYFDKNGYLYTGWHYMGKTEGEKTPHWSYFDKNGYLYTGWHYMGKTEGEKTPHWSYFGDNGWLRTGWQQMGKGTSNPDGKAEKHWSYFGANGWLRTGWVKLGKGTSEPDGNSKQHWSYFGDNGWLRTGKIKIDGKTYKFNSLGWRI